MNLLGKSKWLTLILVAVVNTPAALAIVDFPAVPADQTRLLLDSLGEKVQRFREEYKPGSLENFWFEFSLDRPVNPLDAVYVVRADPDAALGELESVYKLRHPQLNPPLVKTEFARINSDLAARNYVKTREGLLVQYVGEQRGVHEFRFERQVFHLPQGRPAARTDEFPRSFLRGTIMIACARPFEKCSVSNVSIDEAGVAWYLLRIDRGGISSAGGGRN